MLENQSRFNPEEYGESKITQESVFTWHPMNTVMRQESINKVSVSYVQMQDKYFQFGDSTAEFATV